MVAIAFTTSLPFNGRLKRTPTCAIRHTISARTAETAAVSALSRAGAVVAATTIVALSCVNPANAILSAPPCIKGEGPGCDVNAEESPVIRELLEKSRANKEKNDKAVLEKYWQQGYGDYFSFSNKELVKDGDGKWRLQEPEDVFSGIQRRMKALAKGGN